MTVNYDELSKQILDLDTQIRFAGVANSKGEIVAGGQKENVEQILSGDEISSQFTMHYKKGISIPIWPTKLVVKCLLLQNLLKLQ